MLDFSYAILIGGSVKCEGCKAEKHFEISVWPPPESAGSDDVEDTAVAAVKFPGDDQPNSVGGFRLSLVMMSEKSPRTIEQGWGTAHLVHLGGPQTKRPASPCQL